jgi:hypothetical protein
LSECNKYKLFSNQHILFSEKKAQIQQDQFIEIANPPSKEFISLVLKYGGKLKPTALEKVENAAPKPVVRLNEIEEKPSTSTEKDREKHRKRNSPFFLL